MTTAPTASTLTAEDLAMFAAISVSPGTLALARIERVVDTGARERFGIAFDGNLDGLIFPYFLNGRRVSARLRRDHPEIDADGRCRSKYICGARDKRHLYLPPDYQPLLDDKTVPIIFVESEKAVLSLTDWARRVGRKILPMGTGGCWGWRGQIGIETTADGSREPEKGPLPEVSWACDGRAAAIVFDSNSIDNQDVRDARLALKRQLESQGAKVLVFDIPNSFASKDINGPDDFIGIAGDQAFDDLLQGKTTQSESGPAVAVLSLPLNDYGNAQRLIALHGDSIRYCQPMNKFLTWDGCRWRIDELEQHRKLTQDSMLEFVKHALNKGNDTLTRFAGQSLNTRRLSAAIKESQPHLAVMPDELDSNPWLLNFKNGTLDLQTLELREHRREDFITKLVDYDYKPEAQAPRFLAFLDRLLDPPIISYLQKALGYSTTGTTREKTVFLAMGRTDCGKTTLLNLVRSIFCDYATLIMIDALMAKHEDNASRADLADLRGTRFAMTSETEEGQRLRESKLKRIVQGQGRIRAVRKYENPIEFPETHKLWIDCNHRPVVAGVDNSIWNRLIPIPFDLKDPLTKEEIDRELPAKLLAEAEGVITWIVEGTRRWQVEGLGKLPETVEAARTSWRVEMDRLTAFVDACCIRDRAYSIGARRLYRRYRSWAEEAGERPITETMFGLRMRDAGFKKDRDAENRVIYLGIGLHDAAIEELAFQ